MSKQVTVQISREQRDMLAWEVGLDATSLGDFEHAINRGDRESAIELRDKLLFAIELRDAIGWDHDLDVDATQLTVDPEVVLPWLVSNRRAMEEELGRLVVVIERVKQGDELVMYHGQDVDGSVALATEELERERLRALAMIDLENRVRAATRAEVVA